MIVKGEKIHYESAPKYVGWLRAELRIAQQKRELKRASELLNRIVTINEKQLRKRMDSVRIVT
jgi:hypothetical protein